LTANGPPVSLPRMTSDPAAIVLVGDVVGSRRDPAATAEWLRAVAADLDARYGPHRLADFAFTQGDELQGLLGTDADPFRAVLVAGLRDDARRMRWAIAVGEVASGRGPATERTGPAFVTARERLTLAKAARDDLVVVTGDVSADALFDDVAPLLAGLVADLTPRQRVVARLLLVDGVRQADAAERLGVSRATISVVAGRGRVREIGRLARALRRLLGEVIAGADASARNGSGQPSDRVATPGIEAPGVPA
jgi:DNA-directed RNA polymerase specialized sigma24 family protein